MTKDPSASSGAEQWLSFITGVAGAAAQLAGKKPVVSAPAAEADKPAPAPAQAPWLPWAVGGAVVLVVVGLLLLVVRK